jgi:hypothetical protein
MAGCTSTNLFPSVQADAAGPTDTLLTPAQVRQATAQLVSDRERLCAQTVAAEASTPPSSSSSKCPAANAGSGSANAGVSSKP